MLHNFPTVNVCLCVQEHMYEHACKVFGHVWRSDIISTSVPHELSFISFGDKISFWDLKQLFWLTSEPEICLYPSPELVKACYIWLFYTGSEGGNPGGKAFTFTQPQESLSEEVLL